MPRGISRKQDMNGLKSSFMWLDPRLSMAGLSVANADFLITQKILENKTNAAISG